MKTTTTEQGAAGCREIARNITRRNSPSRHRLTAAAWLLDTATEAEFNALAALLPEESKSTTKPKKKHTQPQL